MKLCTPTPSFYFAQLFALLSSLYQEIESAPATSSARRLLITIIFCHLNRELTRFAEVSRAPIVVLVHSFTEFVRVSNGSVMSNGFVTCRPKVTSEHAIFICTDTTMHSLQHIRKQNDIVLDVDTIVLQSDRRTCNMVTCLKAKCKCDEGHGI